MIKKSAALKMGDPLSPETAFGPVVSRAHQKKVRDYIESGKGENTRIAYQSASDPPNEGGFYVPPVIFEGVAPDQKIAREEIFGSIITAMTFRDEAESIRIANNTIYGLSAIVWKKYMGRAHRLACGIRAGWVVVNATGLPAGGARNLLVGGHKQSGIGAEGGIEGLENYTIKNAVQYFV